MKGDSESVSMFLRLVCFLASLFSRDLKGSSYWASWINFDSSLFELKTPTEWRIGTGSEALLFSMRPVFGLPLFDE
jgi:hypothetical protein